MTLTKKKTPDQSLRMDKRNKLLRFIPTVWDPFPPPPRWATGATGHGEARRLCGTLRLKDEGSLGDRGDWWCRRLRPSLYCSPPEMWCNRSSKTFSQLHNWIVLHVRPGVHINGPRRSSFQPNQVRLLIFLSLKTCLKTRPKANSFNCNN